jgi:hypothetical protein
MSNDATVSGTALPAFDRIRATEVETTIRELLDRNRGEVKGLEAQPHPTFENTVLPLEQLSHRLSRTWSPISHLNGVLNSEELRASYNACLPLLSNYWTDLAQSEPLFRAYSAIAANEADRLDPAQRRLIERALEDFRLRRCRAARGAQSALQDRGAGARHARRQVRRKRARRDERLDTPGHRMNASSPGSIRASSSRRVCAPPRKASRAGCSRSSSPPTSP